MTPENEAVPSVDVKVVTEENSIGSDPVALAKTVQGAVVSKAPAPRSRWKWTKKKREAFRLIMQGGTITDVAEKVKAHRNSVMVWMKHPEWQAEAARHLGETQGTTKLRRMKVTSILADKLGAHSIKALDDDDIDVSKAGLTLRSHLEYVRAERELFGEGEGNNGGPGTAVHVHLGSLGQPQAVSGALQTTAVMAFKDFMDKYDPKLAVAARSPQEAAVLLMEKTLQESNLLDIIREEDREQTRVEAEEQEAAKRRR